MEFKSWGHAPTGRRVLSETQGFVTALHSRTQLSQWAGQSGGSEATGLLAMLVPAGTSCFVRGSPELCRSRREGGNSGREHVCEGFMSIPPQSLHVLAPISPSPRSRFSSFIQRLLPCQPAPHPLYAESQTLRPSCSACQSPLTVARGVHAP